MARYWLGPWAWNTQSPLIGWQAPAGALAAFDLRSEPQCAATVTPQGFGLFVTANATALGSDYTNLGTDPTQTGGEAGQLPLCRGRRQRGRHQRRPGGQQPLSDFRHARQCPE